MANEFESDAAWTDGQKIGGVVVMHRGYCDGAHGPAAPCNTRKSAASLERAAEFDSSVSGGMQDVADRIAGRRDDETPPADCACCILGRGASHD